MECRYHHAAFASETELAVNPHQHVGGSVDQQTDRAVGCQMKLRFQHHQRFARKSGEIDGGQVARQQNLFRIGGGDRFELAVVLRKPRTEHRTFRPDRKRLQVERKNRRLFQGDFVLQRNHQIGEFVECRRSLNAGNLLADHEGSSDGPEPFAADELRIDESENRADRGSRAVGVLSAVDRKADRLSEVSVAEQEGHDHERKIHFDVGEVRVSAVFHDFGADGFRRSVFAPCDRVADGAGERGFRGNAGESRLNEFAQVGFDEGLTFERGEELFRIDAVARMVDARIFVCELCGEFGISRRETRPEFAADGRAETVDEPVVVHPAERHGDAAFDVADGDSVFVEREINAFRPGLRKEFAADNAVPLLVELARP